MGDGVPSEDPALPPPLPRAEPPLPLPGAGPSPLVLDYHHHRRAGRPSLLSRISPTQWAVVLGGLTFLFAIGTGRTPALVAGATGLLGGGLVFVYARARARLPRDVPSPLTLQLLAAGVISMIGVLTMIDRARLVSNSIMWLPDNQTHPYKPAFALRPLWLTAVGLPWFAAVALLAERSHRRRLSEPPEPE